MKSPSEVILGMHYENNREFGELRPQTALIGYLDQLAAATVIGEALSNVGALFEQRRMEEEWRNLKARADEIQPYASLVDRW